MDRLVLQIGREASSALIRDGKRSDVCRVVPGPSMPMPSPLPISDRDAWSDLLPPLRKFLQQNEATAPEVHVVPLDVDLEVLSFPKVRRMRPGAIVESHYHVQKATEAMARETVWCTIPDAPIAGPDHWAFSTLSITRHLARRLREIPSALGCPPSLGRVIPYPAAAGHCVKRHTDGSTEASALLDIAVEESCLVLCWRGIPVRYVKLPFGVNAMLGVLVMKLALQPGVTVSFTETEAFALLDRIDLAPERPDMEGEKTPHELEVLHSLFIALERFRNDVAAILEEEQDAWPVRGAPVLVRSARELTGLAEFFEETMPAYDWRQPSASDDACVQESGSGTGNCLSPAVCGLSVDRGARTVWNDLDRPQHDTSAWFSVSQLVVPPLLGLAVGVLAGAKVATQWAHMALPAGAADSAAAQGPSLPQLKAAQTEAASRRRLLAMGETEDRIAREFLADLSRLDYGQLCLDQISLVARAVLYTQADLGNVVGTCMLSAWTLQRASDNGLTSLMPLSTSPRWCVPMARSPGNSWPRDCARNSSSTIREARLTYTVA